MWAVGACAAASFARISAKIRLIRSAASLSPPAGYNARISPRRSVFARTNGIAGRALRAESRAFEHDVLHAMIQHVAPHLLESIPALGDLEKMIAGELTDFAGKE